MCVTSQLEVSVEWKAGGVKRQFVTLNYDQCSFWPPRARKKQKATLLVGSNSSDSHARESTINAGWFDQAWQGFIQLFSIVLLISVNKGEVMFTDFLLSICQCCSCWPSVTSAVVTLVLRSVKKNTSVCSHTPSNPPGQMLVDVS